jgi:hypothetical protein
MACVQHTIETAVGNAVRSPEDWLSALGKTYTMQAKNHRRPRRKAQKLE